ncbi:CHOLINE MONOOXYGENASE CHLOROPLASTIC [Salix viminalis]|uniref:Choline monooxygenase, chloroplastic n=1 Tax=Salix viminalis TaxID=40686 RepID=A0A9Q0V4L3_SALVM|nr:CHOLINE MONOOXYGENASE CHLOROPLASTIC [Salix viminalis]
MTMTTATTMAVLLKPMISAQRLLLFQTQKHTSIIAQQPKQHGSLLVASSVRQSDNYCQNLVDEFDPNIPIEKALTPPSSWYTDPSFFDFELHRVFYRGWQAVGYTEQIKNPRDFFTGRLGNVEFLVCRDDHGKDSCFSQCVSPSCFSCCIWKWAEVLFCMPLSWVDLWEFGLKLLNVATWGPFVLLNLDKEILPQQEADDTVGSEWLGSCSEFLGANGVDSSLSYLCRRVYDIECNWKVFCDNYLDGGYHVPYAHKGLASGLNLNSYSTTTYEKVSVQSCDGGSTESEDNIDRLGSKALYAFIYPNFMINRYGPWMDTNLVLPLGPRKCQVIFDYFIETRLKDDKDFIERSLVDSESVQIEDIKLCEGVQRGLETPAYSSGRYAPTVENAMHHFHQLLHDILEE